MSIIRGERPQSNYYVLSRNISEDKRLGWAARGLLVYLLGKPDHWKVSVAALVNETAEAGTKSGRDTVYKLLNELIDAGYIERRQVSNDGKFGGIDYIVCEQPKDLITPNSTELNEGDISLKDVPHTEEPYTDLPDTVKPTQVINEFKGINELSNTPYSPPQGDCPSEQKKKKPKSEAITFKAWIDQCKVAGIEAIPADDPVFANAESSGLPLEFVALEWVWFKEQYDGGQTRQRDWPRKFRNAVNGAWGKLWWYDAGASEYKLTSAGYMLKNRVEAQTEAV